MIAIEKCLFVNRAPFKENLEIVFKDGVNVLCGINGRGKTTILSYIVDAFYEMARPNYSGSFEGKEKMYYRVSSPSHEIDPSKPSFTYIRFKVEGKTIDYIDVRGQLSKEEYDSLVKYEGKVVYDRIRNRLKSNSNVKMFSCDESDKTIKEAFQKNVLTYFPSYRYELPGYLNVPYKAEVEISNSVRYTEQLINPIEVCTGLKEFSCWLLDVVLDWEVNKQTQEIKDQKQNTTLELDITPEGILFANLSQILKSILKVKGYPGNIRFGIGRRNNGGNRISVIQDLPGGQKEQVCPNLSLLSSGETALLCMFGEIIRQADRLSNIILLSDIHGIVLIDEIEKHLHIRLQKEILPKLLKLFPNVQFIVSSHSPFLNMGLASELEMNSHIYDLDNGAIECEPTTNEVYQSTYELFLNERNHFAENYSKLNEKLKELTRPVVMTEGKTDIKHILKAMEKLGIVRRFDILPEEDQPDGDGALKAIVKNLSCFKQNRKVIAVFDRDNPNVTKDIADPYIDYGNNVYAMRIQCPQSRIDERRTNISIEYLYSDDEIHSVLQNGCQLFFGNEFKINSTRRHNNNNELRLSLPQGCGVDKIIENNGGQAVYDNNDVNHLAKKEEFAKAIVNEDIEISQQSWENFRLIIDVINQIIDL